MGPLKSEDQGFDLSINIVYRDCPASSFRVCLLVGHCTAEPFVACPGLDMGKCALCRLRLKSLHVCSAKVGVSGDGLSVGGCCTGHLRVASSFFFYKYSLVRKDRYYF